MAITYAAGTNTITVTGYTEGTPCNFTDIYNADVAGSWGVVTRQCTNQFCFDCKLVIGDGSTATWFADNGKHILFTDTVITSSLQKIIYIRSNANFRVGTLVDAAKLVTEKGCCLKSDCTTYQHYFIDGESSTAKMYLYYSLMYGVEGAAYSSVLKADGSIINVSFTDIYLLLSNTELKNVNFTNAKSYAIFGAEGDWDNITISETVRGLGLGYGHIGLYQNVKNTVLKRNTYNISGYMVTIDCSVINADVDAWTFYWHQSTHRIYRKYEFDLKVIDKDNAAINGATVKIWDKDSVLVVDTTTNASGVIATQTITRGYYNQANGDTLQEASPHLIKIEKAGYTTYEADFTLVDKTDWTIALQTSILRNPSMSGGMV